MKAEVEGSHIHPACPGARSFLTGLTDGSQEFCAVGIIIHTLQMRRLRLRGQGHVTHRATKCQVWGLPIEQPTSKPQSQMPSWLPPSLPFNFCANATFSKRLFYINKPGQGDAILFHTTYSYLTYYVACLLPSHWTLIYCRLLRA